RIDDHQIGISYTYSELHVVECAWWQRIIWFAPDEVEVALAGDMQSDLQELDELNRLWQVIDEGVGIISNPIVPNMKNVVEKIASAIVTYLHMHRQPHVGPLNGFRALQRFVLQRVRILCRNHKGPRIRLVDRRGDIEWSYRNG